METVDRIEGRPSTSRVLDAEVVHAFPGTPQTNIRPEDFASMPYRGIAYGKLVNELTSFLASYLRESSALGYSKLAVGLSGGIDSVVCAALCRRACPSRSDVIAVTVLVGDEMERARLSTLSRYAAALDLSHVFIDGQDIHRAMMAAWPSVGAWSHINIETRVVQSLIFQVADACGAAVIATTDRSEFLLGRYTEGFYGQVGPLLGLMKSEVYALADQLDLDCASQDLRPGCEGHWYDDEVLGAGYDIVDPLLRLLVDEGRKPEDICSAFGIVDRSWVDALALRVSVQPLRTTTRAFDRKHLRSL